MSPEQAYVEVQNLLSAKATLSEDESRKQWCRDVSDAIAELRRLAKNGGLLNAEMQLQQKRAALTSIAVGGANLSAVKEFAGRMAIG